MADISKHILEMNKAATGAEIRNPLVDALNDLYENGRDAELLNEKPASFYARQTDMNKLLPFDSYPKRRSTKLVTSGGLFALIGDLDDFDWGDD